jgi:hypothetical protein
VNVVAMVPDLLDRSRLSAAVPEVRFVRTVDDVEDVGDDAVVVVDLARPGALDAARTLAARGAWVVGFAPHVDHDLDAGRAAGCAEVLPRSVFFARLR